MGVTNELIEAIGREREDVHADHPSSRPLSDGYEVVGMAGEFAFGTFSGIMPDLEVKPGGDKGIDFVIPLKYTVDVKTARLPFNLLHEASKPLVADIYVLAGYDDDTGKATLLGWTWRAKLANAPVREFGHGIPNHYIPVEELRPMKELAERMRT